MADKGEAPRRYSDVRPPLAPSLREIEGVEVTVTKPPLIVEASYKGKPNMSVTIHTDKGDYHAWSTTLARRLGELPDDAYPFVCTFTKADTQGGQRTWTIE